MTIVRLPISAEEAVQYEVRSSWLTAMCNWHWMRLAAGYYFAWKVRRKYPRYRKTFEYSEVHKAFTDIVP